MDTTTLDRSLVEELASEYREREPLYAVESEQIETLPAAFAEGSYGWRDAEWIVRWYYRRHLGAFPDDERRAREERFRANEYERLREVIERVVETDEDTERVERLTSLDGVDVPIASAFLLFLDPEASIVVGEREWSALRAHDELVEPYPDPPTIAEYESYLDACRSRTDRLDCEMWTLYRALWRLSGERVD